MELLAAGSSVRNAMDVDVKLYVSNGVRACDITTEHFRFTPPLTRELQHLVFTEAGKMFFARHNSPVEETSELGADPWEECEKEPSIERTPSVVGGVCEGVLAESCTDWDEDDITVDIANSYGKFYRTTFTSGEIKRRIAYGSMKDSEEAVGERVLERDAKRAFEQENPYTGYVVKNVKDEIVGRFAIGQGWSFLDNDSGFHRKYSPPALPIGAPDDKIHEVQIGDFLVFPEGATFEEKKNLYKEALVAMMVAFKVLIDKGAKQNGIDPVRLTITSLSVEEENIGALEDETQENARLKSEVIQECGFRCMGVIPIGHKWNSSGHERNVFGIEKENIEAKVAAVMPDAQITTEIISY